MYMYLQTIFITKITSTHISPADDLI